VEGVLVDRANALPLFHLSPSGTLVYWSGTTSVDRQLVWVSRGGVEEPVDPEWIGSFVTPALSPDGTELAVALDPPEGRDLWIKQLDRGPSLRLTNVERNDHRPRWTPDGRSLLFITERGETRDVMQKRADGVGDAEVVLDLQEPVNQAFYSPDGEWLVYRTGRVQDLNIYARRLEGDTATISVAAAPDVNEHSPTLSPDGRWLAYVSDESGRWELYVRPFPDVSAGRWVVSDQGATEPVWGPDGREIFYRNAERALMATAVGPGEGTDFRVGESEILFSAEDYFAYAFQPQSTA
jgi:serine/threonine-protein kinase